MKKGPAGRLAAPLLLALLSTAAGGRPAEPSADTEPVLGAPSGFSAQDLAEETVAVPGGTRLRESPDLRSKVVATVPADSELPLASGMGGDAAGAGDARGPWIRVRFGAVKGWMLRAAPEEPELLRPSAPTPSPERLREARRLMGFPAEDEAAHAHLGPFAAWTDAWPPGGADRPAPARRLERAAASLDELFRERYGVEPLPPAGEAILLFSRRESYETYAASDPAALVLGAWGHAGGGIAAIDLEGRDEEEVMRLAVHELTHLVTRRALGTGLPAWLAEGLSEDLASGHLSSSGELLPKRIGGRVTLLQEAGRSPGRRAAQRRRVTGPRAHLEQLAAGWGSGAYPHLSRLLGMDDADLARPDRRGRLYPACGFFVRFLVDGDQGRWTPGFRAYLADVAAGGDRSPAALAEHLGITLAELDHRFKLWLRLMEKV